MDAEHSDSTTKDVKMSDSVDTSRNNSAVQSESHKSELSWRSVSALCGSALAYFITVGFINAYGVFQQYYTAHYLPTYSNFQISWIGAFANFMVFACAVPAGILADRFGPTIPILIGCILEAVAIFMISLCREYYQFFLAQAVLLGVGMSFIAIPTSTIVPLYFERNRGLAQGLSIAGSSLGGIVWPITLDQMLNKDNLSFGWTMRIIGFVLLPLMAIVLLTVRKPIPTASASYPVGAAVQQEEKGEANTTKKVKKDLTPLKQPPFILLCIGLAIAYFGFFTPLYYIPVYAATSLRKSEDFAFHLVSILNAASMCGRVIPGFLADHYLGHFNTLAISATISGVVTFCWTTATSSAGLVVWVVAYGFTSGAILSLQLACATVLTTERPELRGTAVGLTLASVSLTGLFGPPIAGELVERGYFALAAFAGAALLAGGVLLGMARWTKKAGIWVKV
ncbi:hypothetical protein CKM354_000730200 [Cercospora kikuchii]|uniref:Major facilitator superfamily (MFS) profile domain-containing protein n=1 Tax=Cercospora kikuchii TaxID=84275 RepID=A0A9P3CJW4_9PEZI|nr:uncharacterized protein CKM354_000730200 [Cercospora kikuchii]GIZ44093.1 hypothetical protein CKM354_000730200 [Cercospora kikuchii]